MGNIVKCKSHYFKAKLFSIIICTIAATGFLNAQNQRIFNINNESNLQNLIKQENQSSLSNLFSSEIERFRPFEYNQQLKNFTPKNEGDILLLHFFDNKKYEAVVEKVTVSYDGVMGITAKILNTEFGYCFISISEHGISISADLPQYDEQFFVATKDGKSYLSQTKMSEMKKNELGCDDIDLPEHNDLASEHDVHTYSENILEDAADCTFPPDAITDPVTVNVLIVYTTNAKQYANTHYTSIDNVIDQAFQKANLTMVNSLTNITFNLAYKYETTYTEVNSNQDLYNLTNENDGNMDEVHDLRKQYNADLVMFIPEVDFTGGVAWLLNNPNGSPYYGFGLSRVQQTSWTYTMVHEMGHNMGCGHHWQQTTQAGPGLHTYSSGYRGQNASSAWYSTVMTYESGTYFADGNNAPRIAFFSDPDITHNGVNIGDATFANNALTLRQTKHPVSRYSDYFNPGLKCLSVSSGTLSPVFNTDTTNYTVNVPFSVSSINVYAAPTHPDAIITQGTGQHTLDCGLNTITVTVRAPDYPTNSTKSYTITVIRCEVTVSPADTTICLGDSATLKAIGITGAIFKWYDSSIGGTLLHTGDSYTVSPVNTTIYYVSQTVSGIESQRNSATVTVNPLPNAPAANNITVCYDGNTHAADATAGTDESIVWYTLPSEGTLTVAPSRNTVGTSTAYAAAKNNTTLCESAIRTEVSVTINPTYNTNIYDTICIGESYSFNGNSYTTTGVYTASMSTNLGCDSIVVLNLEVLTSCNQQIITNKLQNAFTPYNQDGINDIFGKDYELYIFSRWGVCL
ncbi:MAG: M12 family metallo-peptidase, partial [Prevotellaceae bacterium]|nr:M12 family metallo-peptidase [Prevotellaceae bacterium]